ncbi:3'(2'),5'-bisphosphate nucleotidase CysQ [Rhodobacterales bacterium HKCCE3408]|nr:3'(2'),5'-bisphosphate nucleotidase CysQ [Rhodobacterales bacterium HKCCE3408]
MPEPETDLDLLTGAARAAGEIAMRHFAGPREAWEKADDQGPVTQADLEVDAMLRQALLAARPDYGWLSEETPDSPDRLSRTSLFVVDPIDGTRAFIAGEKTWAHSLAVVRDGRVSAGVVYLPAKDRLYAAAAGAGARLNEAAITVADPEEAEATLLTSRAGLAPRHWPGGVPPVSRSYRASIANRLALVAEGRFDALVSFRPTWEWDIAAGALILAEAGGRATDTLGRTLRFNNPRPQAHGILGAGPQLHARLVHRAADRA